MTPNEEKRARADQGVEDAGVLAAGGVTALGQGEGRRAPDAATRKVMRWREPGELDAQSIAQRDRVSVPVHLLWDRHNILACKVVMPEVGLAERLIWGQGVRAWCARYNRALDWLYALRDQYARRFGRTFNALTAVPVLQPLCGLDTLIAARRQEYLSAAVVLVEVLEAEALFWEGLGLALSRRLRQFADSARIVRDPHRWAEPS